jgi:hypothetical protein
VALRSVGPLVEIVAKIAPNRGERKPAQSVGKGQAAR